VKVGDLVRVVYDGTVGLVVRVSGSRSQWIYLHTGESFKQDYLEVINETR